MIATRKRRTRLSRRHLRILSWFLPTRSITEKGEYFKIIQPRIRFKWFWSILLILFGIFLYNIGTIPFYALPDLIENSNILNTSATSNTTTIVTDKLQFIGGNAYEDLKKFVKIGPKLVGSPNNEQITYKFIIDKIVEIQNQIKNNKLDQHYKLEISTQQANGSFNLYGTNVCYKGIQNIVAKLSSRKSPSNNSILLNSHFDTVIRSPGGADDGSMVVVMLETLRAFSRVQVYLHHPIVFLFNGGEETNLQGSHAFITQHEWSSSIRAFINLDAAGSSGKEILFRIKNKHLWLFRYYKKYAKYPYAQTLTEELFDFVPSDTDYTMFDMYGNIPGLDLAYCYNGYVYHTSSDNIDPVAPESLQNTGENILSIINALTNAKEIENPNAHRENDHVIFFDIFGKTLISYSSKYGLKFNIALSAMSILVILIIIMYMHPNALSMHPIRSVYVHFRRIFVVQFISAISGSALCIILGFSLTQAKYIYRWYSNIWLIFGLYFCPALFLWTFIPALYLKLHMKRNLPLGNRIQLFLHSQCIILCIINIILSSFKIRSTYLITIVILFYMIPAIINGLTALQNTRLLWILPIITFQIPPFIYMSYVIHIILTTLIPLTGRGLLFGNSELLICCVVAIFGLLLVGFIAPLFSACKRSVQTSFAFLAIFTVFLCIAITPIGFPFRYKVTPARFLATHMKKIVYNEDLTVKSSAVGFVLSAYDDVSLNYINKKMSHLKLTSLHAQCKNELFCASPLISYDGDKDNGKQENKKKVTVFWVPAVNDLNFTITPELKLISKQSIGVNLTRLYFELTGTKLMNVHIAPILHKKLVSWSLNDELNPSRSTYTVQFITGVGSASFKFHFDFEEIKKGNNLYVMIIVIGQYDHHDNYFQNEFKKVLNFFPRWGFVQAWMQSYQFWIF